MMNVKETWKPVTIGGLTGILMGAGAMYGVQAIASSGDEQTATGADGGLKVAAAHDELSFSQAFEAARAEVGAGGVFRWHGKIYNTYTAQEWKAMSHDDQQQFANRVKPEVSPADIDTSQMAESEQEPAAEDPDVQVAQNSAAHPEETNPSESAQSEAQASVTSWNEIAQEENDVRVVGFREITVGSGRSINMQELDINGQRVAVIDVDKDGVPDLAMTDLNHNQQMDEGEVIDLHTGEAISFANDEATMQDMPDVDTFNA